MSLFFMILVDGQNLDAESDSSHHLLDLPNKETALGMVDPYFGLKVSAVYYPL